MTALGLIGKVFVSHSSADASFADRLVADLAAHDVSVWYDKFDLRVGDSVPDRINEGLATSKYFIVVLSKASIGSRWVKEELNSALMQQVARGGTFVLPALIEDCDVPPLLAHRKYADFRGDYQRGLGELLGVWEKDRDASLIAGGKPLYPWPDVTVAERDVVYLHSTRFDKFFRMAIDLSLTASHAINYVMSTLNLPYSQSTPELGMMWSFSYSLIFDERSIALSTPLRDAGISAGSVLKIGIQGTFQDIWNNELKQMWDGTKMYEMSGAMRREAELRHLIQARGRLTSVRLREIADACFAHV